MLEPNEIQMVRSLQQASEQTEWSYGYDLALQRRLPFSSEH